MAKRRRNVIELDPRDKETERYRELWICKAGRWHCAGRLEEGRSGLLAGVFQQSVVPAILMRFVEYPNGDGYAEALWSNHCDSMTDTMKGSILRGIFDSRDSPLIGVVPPPADPR